MSGISHSAFITLLRSGTRYTGYVKGLGDVEWIGEPVHFAKVYKVMSWDSSSPEREYRSKRCCGCKICNRRTNYYTYMERAE